ncbi:MAG: hypothetical protein QOK29_3829, partial [Rhodospirillaceae bacterium]|nr:hypothetical protein [Rhodospirillaceae bacterium]
MVHYGPDVRKDALEARMVAEPTTLEPVAFSCVLEQDTFLVAQCFVWLNCLLEIQNVSPRNIFVHHTGIANSDFSEWLESRKINLVQITPYDSRSPHCNKICQLRTFAQSAFERVVLMDCDTAWVGHEPFPSRAQVAAKIVDLANPPEATLSSIFRAAG